MFYFFLSLAFLDCVLSLDFLDKIISPSKITILTSFFLDTPYTTRKGISKHTVTLTCNNLFVLIDGSKPHTISFNPS